VQVSLNCIKDMNENIPGRDKSRHLTPETSYGAFAKNLLIDITAEWRSGSVLGP